MLNRITSITSEYLKPNETLGCFKMMLSSIFHLQFIYIYYIYKQDLELNNQKELICHKT